ncbi:MAG: hypothetical protein AB8G22_21270 [Saprospiraceae bacterium]
MNSNISIHIITILALTLTGCAVQKVDLSESNLEVINRKIITTDNTANTIVMNAQKSDGLAILSGTDFASGTIELELKGENTPGKSFVGLAFNIQNDSTYEAIYFRPFNFQSPKAIRRQHSIQYIYHPKNNWRYLRTNYEGQYEAEYVRQPAPEDWFATKIVITADNVTVYDRQTGTELLSVKRIAKQTSNRIALWAGYNSKGEYRNLIIRK